MEDARVRELSIIAMKARKHIITGTFHAGSGHPGGSLSVVDVLTYLYFEQMHVDPAKPDDPLRDRFVLSKGHCAPALYGVLAERGFFSPESCKNLRRLGFFLQGHPDMKMIPGVDMSTGSLGQGVSAANGMAAAAKLNAESWRVYAAAGDGELEEGQVWEAAMFAAQNKLDNLILFIDNNGLQIDGDITKVMNPMPIDEKYRSFGWHTITINGHDFREMEAAVAEAKQITGRPTAVICKTVKGKGVSYMENNPDWHGKAPNAEQYEIAIQELDAALKELEGIA